jgi:UDP-N-acetylglucosamine 2-epimerase
LSLLNASSLLIGNSSSGIFEMPSFGKYSINVGKRQKGRIFSKTVIQCDPKIDDLRKKINIYLNKKIIKKTNKNIYYKKYTYENIYKFLRNNKLNTDIKKFRDL